MDAMRKTSEIKCSPAEVFISTKMNKAVSKDIQTVILQCCNTQTFTLKDQKPKRFFTNSFIIVWFSLVVRTIYLSFSV